MELFKAGISSLKKDGLRVALQKLKKNLKFKLGYVSRLRLGMLKYDDIEIAIKSLGGSIDGNPDVFRRGTQPKVLLITHELSISGAPIALLNLALALKEEDYLPIIASPAKGPLRDLIVSNNISVAYIPMLLESDFALSIASCFSLIIANTILTLPIVQQLSGIEIPVLWWIHECNLAYLTHFSPHMRLTLGHNTHVFCVGEYAGKLFSKYTGLSDYSNLFYYLPAAENTPNYSSLFIPQASKKKLLISIGAIVPRKGYKILVSALNMLRSNVLEDMFFVFVGSNEDKTEFLFLKNFLLQHPNSIYYSSLARKEIQELFCQADILVCSSTDDPLPTVVAEALQSSTIVICSEYTGYKEILPKANAGFIYENNDPIKLCEKIEYVFENYCHLNKVKENGRKLFEAEFSDHVFKKKIKAIIEDLFAESGGGRTITP